MNAHSTIESKVTANYLSKGHYKHAFIVSLFIMAMCFLFSTVYWHETSTLSAFLAARPDDIFQRQEYWRLFTSILVHGDLKHLASNSLMMGIMSYYIVLHYGTIVYPLLSFVAGAIVNYMVLTTFKDNIAIVGISGVVYFLWGFWLILYFFIQRQQSVLSRLVRITGVGLVILFPTSLTENVSYLAHFLGLVLGVGFAMIYFMFNKNRIYSYEKIEHVLVRDIEKELQDKNSSSSDLY